MTKFLNRLVLIATVVALQSCIGTDEVEDPLSRLEVEADESYVRVGESIRLKAIGVNQFGDRFEVPASWQSSNATVATVDEGGLVMASNRGQTGIVASFRGVESDAFLLTIIDESSTIAYVEVTGEGMNLTAGDIITLTATAFDPDDQPIDGLTYIWNSSDVAIASVDHNGLVTAVMDGVAFITATAGDVSSSPFRIQVGENANTRTGMFSGKGGYSVSGHVTVSVLDDGSLQVQLEDDFMADNGPGLYVYLSNSSNGVAGGVELGALQSNDRASTYSTTGVMIDDYSYVIILCKPFNVVFGFALLN